MVMGTMSGIKCMMVVNEAEMVVVGKVTDEGREKHKYLWFLLDLNKSRFLYLSDLF